MRLMLCTMVRVLHHPVLVGREYAPTEGGCFVIANHSGEYDSVFMNCLIKERPFAGIMTDEFLCGPGLMPFFFRKLGCVATRKFQPQTTPVRQLIRLIKDDRIIVLMPEGESNWDGVTLPTVASTGKLFQALKVPVHPIIIHNGYLAYPRWAKWPRLVKVWVECRPPLHFTPEMSEEEVFAKIENAINWDPALDQQLYPSKRAIGFRPAAGITRLIFRCPHCEKFNGLREVRGRYLVCDECGSKWRVGGDSYLTDTQTGERRSSTEVFRCIVKLPHPLLDLGPQGKGFIRTPNLLVTEEVEPMRHEPRGRFDCILRETGIDLLPVGDGEPIILPISQIRSISSEMKKKFQIRTADTMYQLLFERGSMIQWQIYIKELLPHLDKSLTRPVDFTDYAVPTGIEDLHPAKG